MIQQIPTAADYHRITSYRRHRLPAHSLDWAHLPSPIKNYPSLNRLPLDPRPKLPEIDFLEQMDRGFGGEERRPDSIGIDRISAAFRLTHDITVRHLHGDRVFHYRNVASAGALYPCELYLAVHRIGGLDPGVYQHGVFDFSLTPLRIGTVPVVPWTEDDVAGTFYITAIFFRSAWKYRSRAYRYVLLDAGHLLENLRLALGSLALSFSIHLDFDDSQAAALLGLDEQREVCLICVHLHGGSDAGARSTEDAGPEPLGAEILAASTVSDNVVAYPEVLAVHRAGNRAIKKTVEAAPSLDGLTRRPTEWIDPDPPAYGMPADYVGVLRQRRSRRNFIAAPAPPDRFTLFTDRLARSMGSASTVPPACRHALSCGFLVGAGMPVSPGFYLFEPETRRLGLVKEGRLTKPMAAACLDQMWLEHAALHMLLLTDPSALDQTWGARGYRYALIEAGRLGQQAYLAATAVGWGACGIGAIYDREAADLLDLEGDGVLVYLVGAGPVKR